MGRQAVTVDLLIPGLLGPVPEAVASSPAAGERFPALERLLSRGRAWPLPVYEPTALLGWCLGQGTEGLPVGPVGWLGAGGEPGTAYWFRVDPVHLRADRDRLMVFGPGAVEMEPNEAEAIAEACNRLLQADGMALRPAGRHWYLATPGASDVHMASIHRVSGHYMDAYLPTGADARRWNTLLSELQMLLHTLALNEQRAEHGQLTINGLWPWGGGYLPDGLTPTHETLFTSDDLGRGAARLAGLTAQPLPLRLSELAGRGGHTLVYDTRVLDALSSGDAGAWLASVVEAENDRCADLLDGLRRGGFDRLRLFPGGGRAWTVTRGLLRRLWRRDRPFRYWLRGQHGGEPSA